MMSSETRNAICGTVESMSPIQAVFMDWEPPSTNATRVRVTAVNPRLSHSSRTAFRRACCCSRGSLMPLCCSA